MTTSTSIGAPRARRRRTSAAAAVLVAALLASLALVTATPGVAGAAPVTLQVSGDAASRNPQDPGPDGPWTYGGGYFADLQTLAESQTFGEATFEFEDPVATVTDQALAGIDVYISSAVTGGYSAEEEQALLRFVQRGGVLLALSNDQGHDVTDFLGATLGPDASGAATATSVASTTVMADRPATISLELTRTHFATLPAGALPLYEESAQPVVALLPFGAIGKGAVILASDSDVFAGGGAEGTPLPADNLAFAESVLNYIGVAFSVVPALQFPIYVDATYRVLLDRPSDPLGNEFWSTLLTNGMARSAFGFEIAKQPEWVNLVVAGLYQDAFGRAPDAAGLAYWTGLIQGGLRVSSVAAELYGSPEFQMVQGGGTSEGWVTAMYDRILGRSPDAGGLAYWAGQIDGGVPATALAAALYLSPEANGIRVDESYAAILNRAPDPGGRAYWAGLLVSLDDIALAAELVASDEFFFRTLTGDLPPVI